MVKGRILRFLAHRGFGFIERPGEDNLFFHIGDRYIKQYAPDPSGEPKLLSTGKPWRPEEGRQPRPQGGDWIYYELDTSRNGRSRAKPWYYAEEYDVAKYKSLVLSGQPKEPMPFSVAAAFLLQHEFTPLAHNESGCEFDWRNGGPQVAFGETNRRRAFVRILETEFYSETLFGGLQADSLYEAGGKSNEYFQNDDGDPRDFDPLDANNDPLD